MTDWFEILSMPFLFPFMQTAFLISVLVAIPMALLSCYVVLKGWSLMGDAISHAVFPGVVLAYLLNLPFIVGAFFAGMFCALSTGWLKENSRVKEDTILGIVFSGMFAFGIVLYLKIETDVHLDHILYGNMLGVSAQDLWTATLIGLVVCGFVLLKRMDLLAHAFDPQHAMAIGLSVRLLHYGLLSMISLAVVGALTAVGLILTIAYLIAPGAIAYLLTRTFTGMMIMSLVIGVGSSIIGVFLSFYIDSAPAPTIVLVMSTLFIVAFVFSLWQTARMSRRSLARDLGH
ncbi:manganese/iron transport system permease protein [Cohaesibacter sp. ES.047]|uniref:metal ABC transporter permease n=1 Tax=Cohaesibacter sp. ES.047 TaxID=1798205 RepID=UPI000BB89EFD|nr:metal ABC transporter permease [Cohaesibacter sp. ES.047]SNY91226.1 manganese/iron transport system permease protein [Cohaesibacter sp. ES.047]